MRSDDSSSDHFKDSPIMLKRSMLLAAPIALLVLTGCTEEQTNSLKNDANQAGEAASNAAETAVDATKQGVHNAAQDIADKTAD